MTAARRRSRGKALAGINPEEARMPRKDVNRKEGATSVQPNPAPRETLRQTGPHARPRGAGKHFRDVPSGPSDLERNPGIGSSPGTFSTGESGIDELDETTGVTPREK